MFDLIFDEHNFVHIAASLYLIGFLFRDQIMLRTLVIAGDVVYILYYLFAPAEPLWGGIIWSVIFMGVNAVMIGRIIADRANYGIADHEHRLFQLLNTLTPGEFRRFMKAGRWEQASEPARLTEEGEPLNRLYYVLSGDITITKAGKSFPVEAHTFIGEVAFLLSTPASATVTVAPGGVYAVWESGTLSRLLLSAPSLHVGVQAALNRDMALKVARA